jgi:hypothetical protein
MNPNTPVGRITLALTLSALLHGTVLWLFRIKLPHNEAQLPPLSATLKSLPLQGNALIAKVKPVIRSAKADHAITTIPWGKSTTTTDAESTIAASSEPESLPASKAISPVATVKQPVAPPLPKHVLLKFLVYSDQDNTQIGEITHQLEIINNKYVLKAETKSTKLARLIKNYQIIQTSHGNYGEFGLRPERYEEEPYASGEKQKLNVTFNWTENKLYYSHRAETELPTDTQDILSFLYQLPRFPLHNKSILIAIATGKKLEQYEFEIGAETEIITPMGKLRALPLHRLHSQGGEEMDVWLGLEYRLLPIKFRQIKRSGEMVLEVVISDIRVADE